VEQQPYGQQPYGQQPYGQAPYGGPPDPNVPPQEDSDKIVAALCYLFAPWLSIIILATDMKNKPLLKYHAYQSLTFVLVSFVVYVTVVGLCLFPFILIAHFYFAYQAYAKGYFVIPTITDWTAKLFKDFPQQQNPY
jgi:uncharacterized membrane protein